MAQVALFNPAGSGNHGCEAIVRGFLEGLKEGAGADPFGASSAAEGRRESWGMPSAAADRKGAGEIPSATAGRKESGDREEMPAGAGRKLADGSPDRVTLRLITNSADEDRRYLGPVIAERLSIEEERHLDRDPVMHTLLYGYRKLTGDKECYLRYRFPMLFHNGRNGASAGNGGSGAGLPALAISIGGDNYCYPEMVPELILADRMLADRGVPTALLGCSIEPDALAGDKAMVEDLKGHCLITVRESLTYAALCEAGIPEERLRKLPDPAFAMPAAESNLAGSAASAAEGGLAGNVMSAAEGSLAGNVMSAAESNLAGSAASAAEGGLAGSAVPGVEGGLVGSASAAAEGGLAGNVMSAAEGSLAGNVMSAADGLTGNDLTMADGSIGSTMPAAGQDSGIVGINVSPLIERYRGEGGETALDAFTALTEHLLQHTDLRIRFVPHVVWANSDDRKPLRALQERFAASGRTELVADAPAPVLKREIAGCQFFVGARTHATIAAYSSLVPTLVVGYSVKSRGIARDLFGEDRGLVLPVHELTGAGLIAAFEDLRAREKELRGVLSQKIPGYRERARENAAEILACVGR